MVNGRGLFYSGIQSREEDGAEGPGYGRKGSLIPISFAFLCVSWFLFFYLYFPSLCYLPSTLPLFTLSSSLALFIPLLLTSCHMYKRVSLPVEV